MSEKPFGYWDYFAKEVRLANDAPLYVSFAEGVAATPWLQEMAAQARPGQPHANIQPYLTMNFIIALQGVFPSRS